MVVITFSEALVTALAQRTIPWVRDLPSDGCDSVQPRKMSPSEYSARNSR